MRTTVIVTAFIVGIGGTAVSLIQANAMPQDDIGVTRPVPPPPHPGSMIGHPGLARVQAGP
jgi:hypothetical protein